MVEEEKDKGFVIKDRRVLKEESEPDQDSATEGPEVVSGDDSEAEPSESSAQQEQEQADMPLPEINFATFIASLNASALVNLGAIADPATGKMEKNLAIAKQTIDIMSMLQEKTKGNLATDEESILKSILYDLRLMYVREKS